MPPRKGSTRSALGLAAYKALHFYRAWFHCPICGYRGPFRDVAPPSGRRRHAQCPSCRALERHRLQYLVANKVLEGLPSRTMSMLHVAPEPQLAALFRGRFGRYETADLAMPGVDHRVDLQALPFPDASYDVVYASHVLEHVPDDRQAISEIRRVLRPHGIAVLPVPIVSPVTIEYPAPNPHETQHVRAPGPDYFERLSRSFTRVELFGSADFPEEHQLYAYEDRTRYPRPESPLRMPVPGTRHPDVVPVCHA